MATGRIAEQLSSAKWRIGKRSLLVACIALTTPANALAGPPSHTQAVDPGNALNAVSCVPGTSKCVVADSEGNTLYSTNISATTSASWTQWSGPAAPGEAITCPSSSLCVLADGHAEEPGVGGNMYYATSLGGSWTGAFNPTFGAVAVSCASTALCVSGEDGEGAIRYTSQPASGIWFALDNIGGEFGAMNGVDCVSPSFCAVVDDAGHIHVANTEAKIKERDGWKSTDIDGATALHGVACSSATSCVAVDGAGNFIHVAVNGSGEPSVSGQEDLDGSNDLTAITCASVTCVSVDNNGNVFVSTNGGEDWSKELALGTDLTSVSCSSITLCVAADTTGNVTAFNPSSLAVWITGEGTVSSNPTGLSCSGEACAGSFEGMVELEAHPAAGFAFAGWLGCERLSASKCEVTVNGAVEVTAVFLREAEAPLVTPFSGNHHGCSNGGLEVTIGGHTSYVCNGTDGASGTNGTNGTDGKEGPRGKEGLQGREGPPGPPSRVTCKVKQRHKPRVEVTCTVAQSASSSRVHLRWRLTSNGHVVRRGATKGALRLNLSRGHYLLYIQGQTSATSIIAG
jgi:hypothetical protein